MFELISQMFEWINQDWVFFVVLILAAAVVAGFLAGLFGIGGGAVMVPVFSEVYVLGGTEPNLAQFIAVGTSLAIIIPTSIRSAKAHHQAGNMDVATLRSYLWFVPIGVILGLVFASLNIVKTTSVLTLIFGIMALLLAIYMLAQAKEFRFSDRGPQPPVAQVGAGCIGFVSLLMGIGGGVMNNMFMMVQGTPMKRAIGTSAAVGTLIAVPGAIGFVVIGWGAEGLPPLTIGYINLVTLALVIPITVIMAPIGARVTHRLPDQLTARLFGLFLVGVSLRMLWKVLR